MHLMNWKKFKSTLTLRFLYLGHTVNLNLDFQNLTNTYGPLSQTNLDTLLKNGFFPKLSILRIINFLFP